MNFDTVILNFTGIYRQESFYQLDKSSHFIDLSDIPGTNCMCDDQAVTEISERISAAGIGAPEGAGRQMPLGLHFLDNGNYHYMSALFLQQVKEPFSLVVFDHHPDMQRPMFDILSCGGWVLEAVEKNEYLRQVDIIGASKELIEEVRPGLSEEVLGKVRFHTLDEVFDGDEFRLPDSSFPVYLSVDKDVISRDEIITNWDQGDASTRQILKAIEACRDDSRGLLGVDICGECAPDQEGCRLEEAIEGNDRFNREVMRIFGG